MLSAPLLERATAGDIALLAAMRAAEGWTENRWLLDILSEWDRGRFFVARPSADALVDAHAAPPRVIAAAGAVAYGRVGFIGNVVVHAAFRRQGLGRQLMRTALGWLESQGVRRVELDATVQGRPVYQQLGFVGTEPSWVVWAPVTTVDQQRLATLAAQHAVEPMEPTRLADIVALDQEALGGDRLGLLQRVLGLTDTTAYMARDTLGAPAGYLVVRPVEPPHRGLHLGPWVGRTPAAAAALLLRALQADGPGMTGAGTLAPHLHACLPGGSHAARELCATVGLQLIMDDLRMRLDLASHPTATHAQLVATPPAESAPAGRPEWVYAMLSTMVG
jgi:GNAT superfamily N-acetyltransferase